MTLPLGIDIGRRRVRVALTERVARGSAKLLAVAARDHDGDPAAALEDALGELQTRERRCVLALAPPDALLCVADFPPMLPWERAGAARFEAARFVDYPIAEAAVSLVRIPTQQRWAIGIARRASLDALLSTVEGAGLRPLAVDDLAFALRRAHPAADGVIDIGDDATRLTLFGEAIPYVVRLPIGGQRLTAAIAQSLGIDAAAAEERKRQTGFGGVPNDAFLEALGAAFADARAAGYTEVRDVVLCGNGSRIPGLAGAIERATGHAVRPATLPAECSDTVPPDVLRAAGADWSAAYGLSLWSIAS
jgi:Tfp pilus assembly PilM family ATPase